MKLQPYEIDELCELAWGYHENSLTPDQAARLEELVLRDRTKRALFVHWSTMVANLQFQYGSRTAEELLLDPIAAKENLLVTDQPATSHEMLIPDLLTGPGERKMPVLFRGLASLRFGTPAFTMAIAFLATAMGVWWFISRSPGGLSPSARNQPVPAASAHSLPQRPMVTSLHSKAGTTTLRLAGIGFVTIEGPTDFCLIGPKRARLNYGRIKVRVTEKTGYGFVIETPDGEVTDLGTEFALNVSHGNDTSLIVHEGKVDLRVGSARQLNDPEQLVGGDAVSFNASGTIQRLMSIIADEPDDDDDRVKPVATNTTPLITHVSDNLSSHETKGYYQIVPRGLREDALSNVGVRHQWNGVDAKGIPAYLLGADYVKGYVRERYRKTNVSVTLSRPAKLYLFWCDEREAPHEWLVREFKPTGDFIGLDANDGPGRGGRKARASGSGPGKSIDLIFSIWVREITTPGIVVLGTGIDPTKTAVYDIAAVELETDKTTEEKSRQ